MSMFLVFYMLDSKYRWRSKRDLQSFTVQILCRPGVQVNKKLYLALV
jgi:hypothetical protein